MWQPRGLDYSLYTVLSRHHSGGKDFSLSSFSPGEDVAVESFTSMTVAAARSADDTSPHSSRHMLLPRTANGVEKEGGFDTGDCTVIRPLHCQNSCTAAHDSAVSAPHRREIRKPAESLRCVVGADVGDDTRGGIVREVPGAWRSDTPEPSANENASEIQDQQAAGQGEQLETVKLQRERMQLQQGTQSSRWRKPGNLLPDQTQQPQPPQSREKDTQEEEYQQQDCERHLPAYFRRVSVPLRGAVDRRGEDSTREPRRRAFTSIRTEHKTPSGDIRPETNEHSQSLSETTASSFSSVSPVSRPPPYSDHLCTSVIVSHAQDNDTGAAAMCFLPEGRPCEAGDDAGLASCITLTSPPELPPSVVAGPFIDPTCLITTANESLARLSSIPVLPSFRVLILFGSTSGVSASVAFSIFHTFVHRLLSSSNRLQKSSCSADRSNTFSLAPVSPSPARSSRQTSPSMSLHNIFCKEAPGANVSAIVSSIGDAGDVPPAYSPLQNSPTACSERKGSQVAAALRQTKGDGRISVKAEALPLDSQSPQNMTKARCLSSTSRRELSGENIFRKENCNTDDEAGAEEVPAKGVGTNGRAPQHVNSEHHWQRQRRQQREAAGQDQGGLHAERGSAQQGKEQQDKQQEFVRNTAGLGMKRSCTDQNQLLMQGSASCAVLGGTDGILEKREAAAQAAEVASMGLKAAAALASAALKAGEQREAARRAAEFHRKEEPKTWFMDEIQIGRVGVYIQSMQYFTFEDLLRFVEESREASDIGAAAVTASPEAAATCGTERISCRRTNVTTVNGPMSPGAMNSAFSITFPDADTVASDERATGCLCENCHAHSTTQSGGQTSNSDSTSIRYCDCSRSLSHSTLDVAASGSSRSRGDDDLSANPHTLILYCVSTNMGGTPPQSASSFFSEVLEAADDFRVSRGSLRGCCIGGVGCGSTDYPQATYCKPARQLMTPLRKLGAQVLMQQPLLLLTDTNAAATTEMKLTKWKQQLVQQVERLLQASNEEDVRQLLLKARDGAFSSRRKQNQQHKRHQLQQQQLSVEEQGTIPARSVSLAEVLKSKGGGSSRVLQEQETVVLHTMSMSDFSCTSDSEEQSDDSSYDDADGDDDEDDDATSTPAAGEKRLAKGKRDTMNSKRRSSTFTGFGSAVCGGSGDDDLEDVANAAALSEAGTDCDSEDNSLRQVFTARGTERRRRSPLCGQQGDHVSHFQRSDGSQGNSHGAHERGSVGEVKKKRQQRREHSRQTGRTVEKMIKLRHAEQLSKEGYRLIGSHSAVKLCRWTKSQLRGRGGCYKHTFYGITSSQCMEMTPSLACANKCIFCWRHHKNPVGTSWRWQMDEEGFVVNEAITQHLKAIKELKGMAEVKQDRLDAARSTIRHCALSLVGEPIMYPRIAALVKLLHEKHISTFLVTNAQFPDALAGLPPVTQLYLSVDAASAKDLKALDQPLFSDYWERFTKCMEILKSKRQRTVYRLTLVAGYNMPDLATLGPVEYGAQSGPHQPARQQATDVPGSLYNDRQLGHTYHAPSTDRAIGEQAGRRGSHGSTFTSTWLSGQNWDESAGLLTSPVSPGQMLSSRSEAPAMHIPVTSNSDQGGATVPQRGECNGPHRCPGRSASDYAALVLKGLPDFIEVKAVTYAGTSKHSKITMKNIPWHDQVVTFCKDLCAALPKGLYELACAHRHSCCVLIAKTEYKRNDQWHTWIDYEKFHELAATGREEFAGTDYCAPTPEWAVFGHAAAGFSPFEARIYTKGKQKRLQTLPASVGICQA